MHLSLLGPYFPRFDFNSTIETKIVTQRSVESNERLDCFLCRKEILKEQILFDKVLSVCKCISCSVLCHLSCMARHFLSTNEEAFATQSTKQLEQLIPVDGDCPRCECHLMWGDLIRRGVSKRLDEEIVEMDDDNDDATEDEDEEFEERTDQEEDDDEDIS